jgi:hypothetical protein
VAQVDPQPGLVERPVLQVVERLNAVLRGDHVDSGCVMHAERVTNEERGTDSARMASLTTHDAHALA